MVTGGERLLDENCEVLCVDNFFTGDKENIKDLLKNPYFEIIRGLLAIGEYSVMKERMGDIPMENTINRAIDVIYAWFKDLKE